MNPFIVIPRAQIERLAGTIAAIYRTPWGTERDIMVDQFIGEVEKFAADALVK